MRFKLLTGDASGIPATYCARVDATTFAVYEINEWADLDSSAIETHGKYNVQSGYVSIDKADDNLRALVSCGWAFDVTTGDIINPHSGDVVAPKGAKYFDLVLVEALWGYGCKDVAADESGNNLRNLIRAARGAL